MSDEVTISFPCVYPIKVIGAGDNFEDTVFEIGTRHDTELTRDKVSTRDSKNGNFQSVTLVLRATGKDQLEALFADLKACTGVRMVL